MVSSLYFTLEVHAHVSFVVKVGAVNVLFTVDPVLSFVIDHNWFLKLHKGRIPV